MYELCNRTTKGSRKGSEIMNQSGDYTFKDGKWVPAECEKYDPNLFERIVDKMPMCIRRLVSKFWFY